MQRAITDVEPLRRLDQRHRFSIDNNPRVVTRVVVLLLACGPAAIVWAVTFVVVDAIKRVLRRWSQPHIPKKIPKVCAPFIAHGNAAPAVPAILLAARIMATLFRLTPSLVLWRVAHKVPAEWKHRDILQLNQQGWWNKRDRRRR
jgi:hypothetical protein